MRQPLIPVFVVLALTALPAAFVQGVRASGAETEPVAVTEGSGNLASQPLLRRS